MLTDVQIRKAKAADRHTSSSMAAGGLNVYVTPAGGKLWRLRYEFERKEKLLSIGPYPSVGVAEAREAATNSKRLLRKGKDLLSRSDSGACKSSRTEEPRSSHRPRMARHEQGALGRTARL
jgi:hypothetical protein